MTQSAVAQHGALALASSKCFAEMSREHAIGGFAKSTLRPENCQPNTMAGQSPQLLQPADSQFELSFVIPAYNEAGQMPRLLKVIRDFAATAPQPIEAIIVDDGSRDGTIPSIRTTLRVSAVERVEVPNLVLRVLRSPRNRGKGHAVRTGVLAANGRHVLLCDADLSAGLEELGRLQQEIDRGADIAIGSRDMPDARLDPPQPQFRRRLATIFRNLRRFLILPDLNDTQCGFKLLTREAAKLVFAHQHENGWLMDCEVLAIARTHDLIIREVGIVWRNRRQSRVNIWRDGPAALWSLFGLRMRFGRCGPKRGTSDQEVMQSH